VAVSTWQARWAKRLDSEILRADAWHTFGDVLTTVAVIAGWQFAAAGWVWMDTLFAVVVAGVVLWLAFNLFRRSVPILVDSSAVDPEDLRRAVESVPGVHEAPRVRSRLTPSAHAADIVITVAPRLTTLQGHAIADEVERLLRERFELQDVVVHLEPRAEQPPGSPGGGGQGA
jgi:cation diffusion facilitator family transporter